MPNKATCTTEFSEVEVPQEFICPLTLEVMVDPVVNKHKQAYERSAIVEWVGQHGTCPLTRRPCRVAEFFTYHQLRMKISAFHLVHGMMLPSSAAECDSKCKHHSEGDSSHKLVQMFLNFSEEDHKKMGQNRQRRESSGATTWRSTIGTSEVPVSSHGGRRLRAPRLLRLRA